MLRPVDPSVPFFCSWPDAFGPRQFEYNTADAYEFLVPASKLAATSRTGTNRRPGLPDGLLRGRAR